MQQKHKANIDGSLCGVVEVYRAAGVGEVEGESLFGRVAAAEGQVETNRTTPLSETTTRAR